MKFPQTLSKELAARTLLLIEQPPVVLGARLRKTTFVQYLRLDSTRKLFACGDCAHVRRKIIADKSMAVEVTVKQRRAFITANFSGQPRGAAYWQAIGKILWIQYAGYLVARSLADKTVKRALRRAKNEARRKLAERKRLMERYKREKLRKRRWGKRS